VNQPLKGESEMTVVPLKKKKESAAIDVNSILKGARKAETASKSKVPVIETTQEVKELAAEVRKLKDEVDSSTTLYEAKSADLVSAVTPLWEKLCLTGYQSSLKVPTPEGTLVGVTFSSNWIKISPDREETISGIVGEKYERYFNAVNVIKVKGDLSNERLTDLIKRVGPEDFGEFFEVESQIKPTDAFKVERFSLPQDVQDRLRDEAGVRPYKPSIKVR